ncbi:class I SAM-dependent methyltransferase [Salininema proteolyticum]|uniref:Class I SAM-dependent methyltransferase n=1 Tax=Salininema proteolyticum TaxID=1607685 RepID=A0ABV8TTZ2_9ACTN
MTGIDARIREYYEKGGETDRLTAHARGRLEFARTQELVRRHLPEGPARIADVGGGTGVHAGWLAADGHDVTLVDPVERHVEAASALDGVTAVLGDARKLELDDDAVDVVLLLGPLYHLTERADRVRALAEARRVARRRVMAATINRPSLWWNRFRSDIKSRPMTVEESVRVLDDGVLDLHERGIFTRSFLHWPAEIAAESAEAGLEVAGQFMIEGMLYEHERLQEVWDSPAERESMLAMVRSVESEPTLLSCGPHLLTVADV